MGNHVLRATYVENVLHLWVYYIKCCRFVLYFLVYYVCRHYYIGRRYNASFISIMLLHESLTHIQWHKKPCLLSGKSFTFRLWLRTWTFREQKTIHFDVTYFAKFPNLLSKTSCHVKVKGTPPAGPTGQRRSPVWASWFFRLKYIF